MPRNFIIKALISNFLIAAFLFPSSAFSKDEDEDEEGSACRPLHFGAIAPGMTKKDQVTRSLGPGIAVKDGENRPALYFTDKQQQLSLYVTMDDDGEVKELTLQDGTLSTLTPAELKKAQSIFLSPAEGFGKRHELHLGASKEKVRANLGKPFSSKINEWKYAFAVECKEPEYATLFFKDHSLFKVVFSAPEN